MLKFMAMATAGVDLSLACGLSADSCRFGAGPLTALVTRPGFGGFTPFVELFMVDSLSFAGPSICPPIRQFVQPLRPRGSSLPPFALRPSGRGSRCRCCFQSESTLVVSPVYLPHMPHLPRGCCANFARLRRAARPGVSTLSRRSGVSQAAPSPGSPRIES